ncbi:hypothetical protein GCM10027614_06850 [Micromonospora vulcania]
MLELAQVRLTVGEAQRAREAWSEARSVLLTFQNGGTEAMRVRLDEVRRVLDAVPAPDQPARPPDH